MTVVLDASAVLAVILGESGAEQVIQQLADGHMATVNLSETLAKLIEYGLPATEAQRQIGRLELQMHDFTPEQAAAVALLRASTREFGLSLGDRACLALGQSLGLPVLTADRQMAAAQEKLALDIRLIR